MNRLPVFHVGDKVEILNTPYTGVIVEKPRRAQYDIRITDVDLTRDPGRGFTFDHYTPDIIAMDCRVLHTCYALELKRVI